MDAHVAFSSYSLSLMLAYSVGGSLAGFDLGNWGNWGIWGIWGGLLFGNLLVVGFEDKPTRHLGIQFLFVRLNLFVSKVATKMCGKPTFPRFNVSLNGCSSQKSVRVAPALLPRDIWGTTAEFFLRRGGKGGNSTRQPQGVLGQRCRPGFFGWEESDYRQKLVPLYPLYWRT